MLVAEALVARGYVAVLSAGKAWERHRDYVRRRGLMWGGCRGLLCQDGIF